MMMLLKALLAFFILVYIHISYSQTPATCLEHLKTEGWPRDGVLRVEILRPGEKVQLKEGVEDLSEELTMPRSNHKEGLVSLDPSSTLEFESTSMEGVNGSILEINENALAASNESSQEIEISISEIVSSTATTKADLVLNSEAIEMTDSEMMNIKETYANESITKTINKQQYEEILKTDVPEVEKLMNAVLPDDQYIVECKCRDLLIKLFHMIQKNLSFLDSLEYGFLRLSAATRQRLNIPVKVIVLDPQSDKCFGDSFSRFILQEFLGYDDLLMASVKVLAEEQDNKGYLRNVITGKRIHLKCKQAGS
jgi:hypothetical protein